MTQRSNPKLPSSFGKCRKTERSLLGRLTSNGVSSREVTTLCVYMCVEDKGNHYPVCVHMRVEDKGSHYPECVRMRVVAKGQP